MRGTSGQVSLYGEKPPLNKYTERYLQYEKSPWLPLQWLKGCAIYWTFFVLMIKVDIIIDIFEMFCNKKGGI